MKRALLMVFASALLLIGCWDSTDIENRGFVLGIAIDKYPPNPQGAQSTSPEEAPPKEEERLEVMELHTGQPLYAMTIQLPIVKKAQSAVQSSGGSGGNGSRTWEITQVGNSFIGMNRELQSRVNLSLYYEHLQVIILSEEVAKEGIEKILDFFVRDPEMRRRVKIFISAGEAKKILDTVPRIEDYSSMYLSALPRNATKNSRMIHKTDLGEVINNIHGGNAFVLPKVESTKDEIKTSGGAVFKGDKMVGWLGELELEALKFIRNLYKGGVVTVKVPGTENGIATLNITRAQSKVIPIIEGEKARFLIEIKVEGNYAEEIHMHTHGLLSKSLLDELEKEYAKEIERICIETIKKVQRDYGADIFRFDQILKTEEPVFWKKVGKDWDSIFPGVEAEVKADVSINLLGIVK